MNDQLRQYYEDSFAPNNLPPTHQTPFEQLDAEVRNDLENSFGFAGWKLQQAMLNLGQSIKEAIAPVSPRTALWIVGGLYIVIRVVQYLAPGE